MQLNPYLSFAGDCEEAFTFYAQCLGGNIEMLVRCSDTPAAAQMPENWQNKIMHAQLSIDGCMLMGTDAPHDRYQKPQGFSITLGFDDPAETEGVFNALSVGGTVEMELQKTFWAHHFGVLKDRFGISWMFNCICEVE